MNAALRLAAAGVLVSACAVDGAPDVAAYREVLDAGLTESAKSPVAGGRLDVVGAMRLANSRNEALSIEGENYTRALLDRRRAAAAYLPRIVFAPSLFRDEHTSQDERHSGLDAPVAGFVSTNPLVDEAEIERAGLTAEERRSRLLALQDTVLLDAARTLLGVVLAERSAEVLRSSIRVQEARVEDARARRDAGLARPLDAALAESRAAGTRTSLIEAETIVRRGRALLAFLTDASVDGVSLDDALTVPAETPALAKVLEEAAERREEITASEAAVRAALAGTESAYGRWWPTISANVTGWLSHDSGVTSPEWTSVLAVSVPLFSAGVIEIDVRSALSRLREAHDRASLVQRGVTREVTDAWSSFEAARRRIDESAVRLDAARRAAEEADGLWTAGLSTNLERLAARDEELSAGLELADAEIGRKSSWLDLLRAKGSLHELIGLDRARRPAGEEPSAEAR